LDLDYISSTKVLGAETNNLGEMCHRREVAGGMLRKSCPLQTTPSGKQATGENPRGTFHVMLVLNMGSNANFLFYFYPSLLRGGTILAVQKSGRGHFVFIEFTLHYHYSKISIN
jgi:hypothetical protein